MSLKTKGIKFNDGPSRIVSTRLPFWHIQLAKKVGDGNISKGVRIALESLKQNKEQV